VFVLTRAACLSQAMMMMMMMTMMMKSFGYVYSLLLIVRTDCAAVVTLSL